MIFFFLRQQQQKQQKVGKTEWQSCKQTDSALPVTSYDVLRAVNAWFNKNCCHPLPALNHPTRVIKPLPGKTTMTVLACMRKSSRHTCLVWWSYVRVSQLVRTFVPNMLLASEDIKQK